MFHCGDIVEVTNPEHYYDAENIKGKKYVVVGIHPITTEGKFSKNTDEIQFICTGGQEYLCFIGKHLHKIGYKSYSTEIFDKTYNSIGDLKKVLIQPKNEVETYIYTRCLLEVYKAQSKFGDVKGAKVKVTNVNWGTDYATHRGNGNKSSLEVHIWKDADSSKVANMKILCIVNYVIPTNGNMHIEPYGKLKVTDGRETKVVSFKADKDGRTYFCFNRKRYYIVNMGSLYAPKFMLEE